MRVRADLFIASVLVLFLELACIRWFPAHVLFLTFFTNVMLLASFLGISVGCLAAGRSRNYLAWTPLVLVIALGAAHLIEWERLRTGSAIDVGNHLSPQLVFFGVESQPWDPSKFVVPIEAVSGALFVLVAFTLVGPGQQLGRSLARISNRVEAYTINIAGSLAGIFLFTVCSRWELGPVWWFGGVLAGVAYFLVPGRLLQRRTACTGGLGGRDRLPRLLRRRPEAGSPSRHRRILVPVLPDPLRRRSAVHHGEPDRPPADELSPFAVSSLCAAAPAESRQRAGGFCPGPRDRRRIRQRREPRAGVGGAARRCRRDRSGDLSARAARSSGPAVRRSPYHRAPR